VTHDRLLTPSGCPETLTAALLVAPNGAACPGTDGHPAVDCSLPPLPGSAGRAREFTKVTLDDWGMTAHTDVAELVVCELVTNALRHGLLSGTWTPEDRPIRLTLLRRNVELMCMVTDPGSAAPVRVDACASSEGGRGLQVVEACSAAWGWQPLDGAGKVVWALLR
jgi:anti-sigma regulatory factor (Ser/Thr protein kinase)